jgi:hypothetical protein
MQTGVRIKAHAALIAILFPRQQNQIGQDLVAKNSPPPGNRVRPPNPVSAPGRWFHFNRRFQFLNTLKEFPTLPRRQRFHLLQKVIRTHP